MSVGQESRESCDDMTSTLGPDPVCVLDVGATLGEGPVWNNADRSLLFVDIAEQRIFRFEPASNNLRSWSAPAKVGWVLPSIENTLLVGLTNGIHRFAPESGTFEHLLDPEPHLPTNRLNDAALDRFGRLWFGTMDDREAAPLGRLYRIDEIGCTDVGLAPATITNGPALAPDGRTVYPVDTFGRRIYRVRIREDGSLEEAGVLAEIESDAGYPDGATCDAEGCVWVGLFSGWAARRYSPDGELLRTVRFPVANVTKIAFGGDDMRTAYATTARKGLSVDQIKSQPLSGNLFAFDAGVAGNPVDYASAGLKFAIEAGVSR